MNPLSRGLLRLFRFWSPIDALAKAHETADFLEDFEAFDAALVEKKLTIMALVTALEASIESSSEWDREAVRTVLRSLCLPAGRTAAAENALTARAGTELVVHLVARLAVERGESPRETWQREAEILSKILAEGNNP